MSTTDGHCTCGTVNIVKAKYRGMVYPCYYCKTQELIV